MQHVDRAIHAADDPGEEHPQDVAIERIDSSADSLMFLDKYDGYLARWAAPAWDRFLLAQIAAGRFAWLASCLLLGFVPVKGPPTPSNRPTHVRVAWSGEICPLHYGQDVDAMQPLRSKVSGQQVEVCVCVCVCACVCVCVLCVVCCVFGVISCD